MRPIKVRFMGPPSSQSQVFRWVVFAVGGVLASLAIWHAVQIKSELLRWEHDLQSLKQVRTATPVNADVEQNSDIKTELAQAHQIVEQLNVPWAALFNALESPYSEHAILLGAEPDSEQRQVKLSIEAKDLDSMLEFVKQIRATGVLADAHITAHQVNQQDPHKPVRVIIASHWLDVPPSQSTMASSPAPAAGATN